MTGNERKRRARGLLVLGGSVLFVGALLYLARPTDPAAVRWLEALGIPCHGLRAVRAAVFARIHPPAWVRGSASDFAYAFALGTWLVDARAFIAVLGGIVVVGHELLQAIGLVGGTFDMVDLVVLFVGFVLPRFIPDRIFR